MSLKKIIVFILFLIVHCTLKIEDCVSQWSHRNYGTTINFTCVSVVSNNTVWASGYVGTTQKIIKTTNSGLSWSEVVSPSSGNGYLYSVVEGIDANTALVGINGIASERKVYRTTNGGANWTPVLSFTNFVDGIKMRNTTTGFVVCDPYNGKYEIFRTTNGGIIWDSTGINVSQDGLETGEYNSLFVNDNYFCFGTSGGRICMSTNSGSSWAKHTVDYLFDLGPIWFADNGPDYAGNSYYLYISTNNGVNWNTLGNNGTGAVTGVRAYGNFCWVSRAQVLYYTSNHGSSWIKQDSSMTYNHMDAYYYSQIFYIWAVGNSGNIITVSVPVIGIKNISTEIPYKFSLKQNYPNPFNPMTKIKFEIPSDVKREMSNVKFVIYDILGKEISTLVNEALQPGTYEVTFEGSNLPSGIYFYQLRVEDPTGRTGGFVETRKLILLK